MFRRNLHQFASGLESRWFAKVCPSSIALGLAACCEVVTNADRDDEKSIHIIRGPPGGGKTTLCAEGLARCKPFGQPCHFFGAACTAVKAFEKNPDFFHQNTAIIDDCQVLFEDNYYLGLLNHFKNRPVKVILCGTMGIAAPTPFAAMETRNYYINGLFGDRQETKTWFTEQLLQSNLQWSSSQIAEFASLATVTTSHHVGLLQSVGCCLTSPMKPFSNEADAVSFVINAMRIHRLLALNGQNRLQSGRAWGMREEIAKEILACGSTWCDLEVDRQVPDDVMVNASDNRCAVNGGLFFPRNTLMWPKPGLVVLDGMRGGTGRGTEVCLAHPTQWEFSTPHIEGRESLPQTTLDTPKTLIDLILAVVPCFEWKSYVAVQFQEPGAVLAGASTGQALNKKNQYEHGIGSVRELTFRKQIFNATLQDIFSTSVTITSELPAQGRSALVEAYRFNSTNAFFGVEFLSCHRGFNEPFFLWEKGQLSNKTKTFAEDFAEHHHRWVDPKKYQRLASTFTHSGTVGIVGPMTTVSSSDIEEIYEKCKEQHCGNNTPWAVVWVSSHSEAWVYYGDNLADMKKPNRVQIVRNGVPQKLGKEGIAVAARHLVGPTAFHAKEPALSITALYVAVTLPGVKNPVVTDIASTLKKEGMSLTVDGLKEAVLKECPHKLLKYISHFTVYPPAATKGPTPYGTGASVGDIDAALQNAPEEAPYHVVIS